MAFIPQPSSVALGDGHVELASLQDVAEEVDTSLPSEGYTIEVSAASGVSVKGGSAAGLFYGRQTLRQLLPPAALRKAGAGSQGPWRLREQEISDAPSSGLRWRGCMLDVARHYMPVSDVLRFIDLIAFHKLNVLHLHLTDDQGWRIDVPSWPRLASAARRRLLGRRPARGGRVRSGAAHHRRPRGEHAGPHASRRRGVPELGNTDVEGRQREGSVRDAWGVSTRVLNVSDATLDFCRQVLDFVCDVFPSKTIGIGGDECPYEEWRSSAAAQTRMRELGLTSERELHGWLMGQMAAHLASRGRRAYGWDEIMAGYTGPPEAVQVAAWRGPWPTTVAARRGFDVTTRRSRPRGNPPDARGRVRLRAGPGRADGRGGGARRRRAGQRVDGAHGERAPRRLHGVSAALRLCRGRLGEAPGKGFEDFRRRLEEGHLARLAALGVNYRPQTGPRPWDARPDAPGRPLPRAVREAELDELTAELKELAK
ncbi:hypothetical protein ACCO45_010200 [Purpureocillium lilacinum]|uniref:Uncharacterized protein n=1 Tax=Purpureocillium lilacinum TaxID=33203 RepID=A0ACC4DE46_PURLI